MYLVRVPVACTRTVSLDHSWTYILQTSDDQKRSRNMLRYLILVAVSFASATVCDGHSRCPLCDDGSIECSSCLATVPCIQIAEGVQMPIVGLGVGASAFGSECDEPPPNPPFVNESCFIQQAKLATKAWVGRGGALVETAQDDLNQVPVGTAIKESGVDRRDVFLMTKCIGALTFEGILECVYDALQMLQTDYIDLVILHSPMRPGPCFAGQVGRVNAQNSCGTYTARTDPGDAGRIDSWRGLEVSVKRGLVRAIGLSDFSAEQLDPIVQAAEIQPAVVQVNYYMGASEKWVETKAYCDAHGIAVQTWGPLGSPILGLGWTDQPKEGFLSQIDFDSEVISGIAAKHGVTVQQVALRWVVEKGGALVVGTGNPVHMASDSRIFHFALDKADMEDLADMLHRAPQLRTSDGEGSMRTAWPFGALGTAALSIAAVAVWVSAPLARTLAGNAVLL